MHENTVALLHFVASHMRGTRQGRLLDDTAEGNVPVRYGQTVSGVGGGVHEGVSVHHGQTGDAGEGGGRGGGGGTRGRESGSALPVDALPYSRVASALAHIGSSALSDPEGEWRRRCWLAAAGDGRDVHVNAEGGNWNPRRTHDTKRTKDDERANQDERMDMSPGPPNGREVVVVGSLAAGVDGGASDGVAREPPGVGDSLGLLRGALGLIEILVTARGGGGGGEAAPSSSSSSVDLLQATPPRS
jgi:hypothetical protein